MQRLTFALALTALVVAVLGSTSIGTATVRTGVAAVKEPLYATHILSRGPRGRRGRRGARGPRGYPGAKGETGSQGPKGDRGAQGAKGDSGAIAGMNDLKGKPCSVRGSVGLTTLLTAVQRPGWEGYDVVCVYKDTYEPNDTKGDRTILPASGDNRVDASIFPAGNDDWYDFSQYNYTSGIHADLYDFTPGGTGRMDVYVDGALVKADATCYTAATTGQHTVVARVYSASVIPYNMQVQNNANTCPT